MTVDDIKKICVVGAGNMGHQISLLCAIHGIKPPAPMWFRKS